MENIPSIEELVSDHEKFNSLVYTPLSECIKSLTERKINARLRAEITHFVGDLPKEISDGKAKAVIFRQITTPNYEIRRFLDIVKYVKELEPFFGEYRDDKFTSNNPYKHSWGKIPFFSEKHRTYEHLSVVDLVKADGQKISDLKTSCGSSLVQFHHDFFEREMGFAVSNNFFDISPWLASHGKTASNYYKIILSWFMLNAVLFENFSLNDEKELAFTKNIFLPAFIWIYETFKVKPLIVSFLPIDTESDKLWVAHPISSKRYIQDKLETCYILNNL